MNDNNWKIALCQGDSYTSVCLLNYNFKNYYQIIAIDLSKQRPLDDPKAIQRINFTGNLE